MMLSAGLLMEAFPVYMEACVLRGISGVHQRRNGLWPVDMVSTNADGRTKRCNQQCNDHRNCRYGCALLWAHVGLMAMDGHSDRVYFD